MRVLSRRQRQLSYLALCGVLLWGRASSAQRPIATLSDTISSGKGQKTIAVESHPLAWWMSDPLRFDDSSGDLLLGFKADDGHTLTSQDYKVEQKMTPIGRLRGHRIVQVITDISALHASILGGYRFPGGPATQWKQLLVETDHGNYEEIYRLLGDSPDEPMHLAAVYGYGAAAVLGTYDPGTGNGGGCADGYWWFDRKGAHEVDFTPLDKAVQDVLPPGSVFTSRCWALHLAERRLDSWAQRADAECHACGSLGEVYADYRLERGRAVAISVRFVPQADAIPLPAPAIRPQP